MAEIAKRVFVEVQPRLVVDLDTAKVCMRLVDWFLDANDDYRLEVGDDGKWHLTDEPLVPATGGIYVKPLVPLSDDDKERLDSMPALKNLFEQMGARFE